MATPSKRASAADALARSRGAQDADDFQPDARVAAGDDGGFAREIDAGDDIAGRRGGSEAGTEGALRHVAHDLCDAFQIGRGRGTAALRRPA
jgi:hypothetical protein